MDDQTMTRKGPVARARPEGPIADAADFLGLLMGAPSDTVAFDREDFAADFWELRTGLLGACLQKASNYGRRVVVLGDFSAERSKSLRDFLGESNATGKVVFAATLEEAVALLR